jgi:hypothetical protein
MEGSIYLQLAVLIRRYESLVAKHRELCAVDLLLDGGGWWGTSRKLLHAYVVF